MAHMSRRSGLLVASAGLFAGAGALAARVYHGRVPLDVDRTASRLVMSGLLRAHLTRTDTTAEHADLVLAVAPTVIVVIALTLAAVAWRRRDHWALLLCLVGPPVALLLTEWVGKPLVGRHGGSGFSFPSGHATATSAIAALMLVLVHRWRGRRVTLLLAPLALVLPLGVCVAVLQLQLHYATDILGGVFVGFATVLALAGALPAQLAGGRLPHPGGAMEPLHNGRPN